jgi:hypothetical protein
MSSKKKIAAVAVTAVALSLGTVGVTTANAAKSSKSAFKSANAGTTTTTTGVPNPMAGGTAAGKDGHGPRGGGMGPASVLASLVTKGTITQAQSDAIVAAHKAFEDAEHAAGATPTVAGPEDDFKSVLASLVTKGTITQAQSDAIVAAAVAARPADMGPGKGKGAPADKAAMDAHRAAEEALVASTLGIDAATIKTRLQAGETLAAIAGAKKDALIAALVAFETKEIDARVTAGTLTAAQATTLKADLTAHVTAEVNAVGGKGMGPKGGKGKGPRH